MGLGAHGRKRPPAQPAVALRSAPVLAAALACLVLLPATAAGNWNGTGGGGAAAKARTIGAGNTPTTSINGRNVTVTWTASGISGGGPNADGYIVKRYDTSNNQQSIGASCSGTVTGLTCTESNVPSGSWKYSVTPAWQNWRGAESSQSATQTVASATFTLSSSSTVTSLPATLNGDLASFKTGATVTYRLDNPTSGTVLSATTAPSTIGSNGAASVSVTIPNGTSGGSHTIYAIGSSGDQASVAITVNTAQVTATAISKTTGCEGGYTKQGGTYYVYANATGSPASVTADVSNITTGQTSVNLVAGSYTVDGVSYGYRSASLTADASLAAGSKSYTVTPAGGASANGSVTIDNTQPTASNIQLTNKAGGTAGRPEIGDLATYTFSEAIDPCSLVSGWDGSGTTSVVVRITQNGSNDTVTVWNPANTTQLPLGSVASNSDLVSGNATFGLTGTASTMSMSGSVVTVTLGTASSGPRTSNNNTASVWTPSTSVFDWAGNSNTAATATESGGSDLNF